MGRVRALRLGIAFVLLVSLELVSGEGKCRSGCQGAGAKTYKYVEGTTYKYNLEGSVDVSLSTAENQQSSTKIKATVLLTQLPQCNQLLRLQNVQVIGPDAKKYGSLSDIDKPVRINFNDGLIDDSLCTVPKDNQNSLNIKRAVASLFQTAVKRHHQTDVFGVCHTEVKTRHEGPNVIVQKTRNLNKCAHRETISQDFMATAFNMDSDIKATPVLNGHYASEQRIKNGILDYASVTENYLHVPFSVGQNGAKASAITKIQLIGSSKEAPQDPTSQPRSIIFETPHMITNDHSNVDSILNALKETKNTMDITVGENSAKAFLNLFKILQASKKDDILTVFRQVKAGAGFKDKEGARKVFLDAVFRAGTGECVEVAIELLKSKELTPVEQKLVYLSMAFVKHATLDSLLAATALLEQSDVPREAYLGVGTLARRFCRDHSCDNVDAVNKLAQKVLTKLGSGKPKGRKEENEMIGALKALNNMGILNDAAVAKVIAIGQDKKAPSRLRVAALETYTANACKDKIRDSALGILKDIQQDSEFRIKAYLVVAKCPIAKTANAIKTLLDNEPSHQVGGFIVSHIRNLRASVNPDKEHAKQVFGQVNTNKRFPFDLRKYSFNNEYSGAINSYGVSGVVESNVIYSHESFLPVSADVNVTAEIFGATYNFLELGIRQENLGRVLEHYFGPLGVFNSASPEDLVNSGKTSAEKLLKHFQDRVAKTRGKRDVSKADVDAINKQVHIKTHELNKDLDVDISVKMFGSERLFLSISDQTNNLSPEAIIDQIFDALDNGINKAKNFEKSIQSNFVFLDSEFSYPTSLGFPLKVSVEGTSSVQAKVVSKVDVRAILNNNLGSSPLKVSLIPSASIEVSGSITVDAQVVESGLKYSSNLYSATGSDLEVRFTHEGSGIDVKFSLPVQDQKLISASHEIVFNTRELGKPEHNQAVKFGQNKDFSVCADQLAPIIGLTICTDINSPPSQSARGVALPYPLSGNAKFTVKLLREDLSHFHFSSVHHQGPSKMGAEFVLESIGANNNKKVSLEVQAYAYPETYIKADLISPIMPLTVEGRVTDNNEEKSLSLQVKQEKQQYLAKIGFTVSGNEQKKVYKPIIQYNGPGIKGQKMPLKVEGAINVEQIPHGVKYVYDNLRIIGSNQKAITVQGSSGIQGKGLFSDVTVSDGHNSGSLKGKVELVKEKLHVEAELKNTFDPIVNFKLKYDFKHQSNLLDSDLEFTHGQDLASKTNTLKLSNLVSFKKIGSKDYEITTKNKFSYPVINVNSKIEFEAAPKKIKYDVDLHYGDLKVGSELDAKVSQKVQGDYDVKFKLRGFENRVELKSNREILGDKSKIANYLDVNGNKFELDGVVTHHVKPDDLHLGTDLVLKVPGRADPIKFQQSFILKPTELDTYLRIISGSNTYVDFFVKSNRMGNANGDLKITLKEFVVGNGNLKVARGAGTAFVVIDFVKFHRKFKLDSSFTVSDPKYDLVLTFYPNFEKDNNNKLVLSTHNQLKPHSLQSDNFIEISGKKLEINAKASNDGKDEAELEVILPTNHYYLAKAERSYKINKDVENGNFAVHLEKRENKNAPGAKLHLSGVLKDTDRQKGIYDVSQVLSAENEQGKNVKIEVGSKRQLQAGQYHVNGNVKISGSVVPNTFEVDSSVVYKGLVGDYKIDSKYGQKDSLGVTGKYDLDDTDNKMSSDVNLELKSSSKLVHLVKMGLSGSVKLPEKPDGDTQVLGSAQLFVEDTQGKPAIIDAKVSGEANVNDDAGTLKTKIELQNRDPVTATLKYELNDNKATGQLTVDYERSKSVKTELSLAKPNEHEYHVDFKLDAPQAPGTHLTIVNKESPDGKTISNEITVIMKQKKFVLSNELVLSDISPAFDIKLVYPNGKSDYFSAKLDKFSAEHVGGVLKIGISHNNFALESDWDANLENVDNFVVKVNVHSPALKLDRVQFEAQNKQAKGGKRIQIVATSAGKNLLSGSTSYKAREEGNKYVLEGSGSFKINEATKQANFKFVRQALSSTKHGEEGAEITFNAAVGSQAIDAEFKATDKQFRIMNSYCEEKQQCAHIEIDSKTNVATPGEYNNELEVALDLRKLGLSHEFGLKGVTVRKGFVLDHNVDVYFQEKANKYQYSVYVHPNEAGAQLTTPKRIIALEGVLQVPKGSKTKPGSLKGELAFYLDKKNQASKKTALLWSLSCNGNAQSHDCNGEAKFTNPALGKDLGVKFSSQFDMVKMHYQQNAIIDVFANPNNQIVISGNANTKQTNTNGFTLSAVYEMRSQGMQMNVKYEEELHLDYEKREFRYVEELTTNIRNQKHVTGVRISIDSHDTLATAKICDYKVANFVCKHTIESDKIIAHPNLEIMGWPNLVGHLELIHPATMKYTVHAQDHPNDKLSVYAAYVPDQVVEYKTEILKNGAPIPLTHASVRLDERNFLKSDSGFEPEHINKYIIATFKDYFPRIFDEMQKIYDKFTRECSTEALGVAEVLRSNIPNFKPLKEYYQNELKKLHDEIISDKTLKEVEEFLIDIFGSFVHSAQEVFDRVNDVVENVVKTIQEQTARTIEIVNKEIIPKLAEIGQTMLKVGATIVDQLVDLAATYAAKMATFFEEHRDEIKRFFDTCAAVVQGRALYKISKHAQIVVSKEWNDFAEGVRKLPIAEELKAKYEQLLGGVEIPTALINTLKEAFITLKDAMPSQDLKKLVAAIGDYVDKKLKNEKIDDIASLQNIIRLIIDVIDKVFSSSDVKGLRVPDKPMSLLPDNVLSWPKLGAVKLSPINYMKAERLPSLTELLYAISLNPEHWIPPYQLDAIVVQGQHIFTFDGKHMTFPGDCSYLLVRDAFNGNFTVIGTLTKGLLTAITFSDKGHLVTLRKGGGLLLNNAAVEFPIHVRGLDVFRDHYNINIKSKSGIHIICDEDLFVCYVKVSGYYHGQLRGLLGNGNTEPFDDFIMPNGKIVTSESEFGNSYKVGNCQPVKTVDHNVHQHNQKCNNLFNEDSNLRLCYPFVNPENFKIACDHGLAANVPDTETAIASGYFGSCMSKFVPVQMPSKILKCKNGPQVNDVRESFSVKTPGKAADIVIIIDQSKANEVVYKEWVQPMLSQIVTDLNAKGVSDVEMHVITFGGDFQDWPSHHTVSGKLTFKGRSPNLKFSDPPKHKPVVTGNTQLDSFFDILKSAQEQLKVISGQTAQKRAYTEAISYPFRAHAVKSIIGVISKPCGQGVLVGLEKLRLLLLGSGDITLNLITPFATFTAGDPKYTNNVIGFNAHNIFATSDSKKKLEGSADHYGDLDYNDQCVDFVLKQRGSVFVVNNFLQVKGGVRKQFAQVASHNIVEQMTNVEHGLDCECRMTTPYSAQNVCRIVSTKEKPAAGRHAATDATHSISLAYGNQRLNYKERTTYSYRFSGKLFLNLPNKLDVKGSTQVGANVFITPQNACEYVLQLQDFRIEDSTGKIYRDFEGIEKPVTFQYLGGSVGPEICAETDDPPRSLNVKRAVISHLQLDSNDTQTDIFGECPTSVSVVAKDKDDTLIRKMRNLRNCKVSLTKGGKSVPILRQNVVSFHRLNDGVVQHADIHEGITLTSDKVNATVQSVLKYIGTVAEIKPNVRATEIKTIMFEDIPTLPHKSTKDSLMTALDKFGTDAMAVSNVTAQNFLNLVKIMRDSTKEDLVSVYLLIGNTYFRKIFLDALLRCGTSEAMMATIELKNGKKLQRDEEEMLYQGFAYVRYPTPEIVRAAADLLSDNRAPTEVYPNIGTLVGRYCERNICHDDDVVAEITTKFASKLGSPSKTEVVYALKGLSNAKHLREDVARQVFALAQNADENNRLRSAAYDVLAKIACISDMRDGLVDVLKNTEEDSEIRIKSYLVLAKCPDQHVRRGRRDASKQRTQLPKVPYNISGFSGKTGAEVIYSQKSFLPRFAKVNVSANMFGSDIDLFELEMRQENLDRALEYFTGPVNEYQIGVKKFQAPNIDLDVDVSMKLFGTEFPFTSFSAKPFPYMNQMFNALSKNVRSKLNFELNKQNGVIFIDSQLSYPTSMGFPIKLSVEGVSSAQMRVVDDVDDKFTKYGLTSSIDLDVVSGIAMDAAVVETGVKAISKVHIATGFAVNSQQGEIKISLPLEQQEVSISHDMYVNRREFGKADSMELVRMNEEEVGCLEGFADYTGLNLCVRYNAPSYNDIEYLGGSYKAAVVLNNVDFSHASLSHRFFPKRTDNEQEMSQISAKIFGRRQNIKTGAVLEFSRAGGYMARFTTILPKQNASAEVRLANTANEKFIFANVNFGKQNFSAKFGVEMSQKPHKLIYNPLLYVAIPKKNSQSFPLNTKGSVVVESNGKDFKVRLEDLQLIMQIDPKRKIYSAKGSFGQDVSGYALDLTVSNGNVIVDTAGKVQMSKEKFNFDGHITNNKRPELNFHVNYECARTRTLLHHLLEAVHGSDRNSTVQRLIVRNDAYFDGSGRIIKSEGEITYPRGEFFASNKFERTNASFDLDAKFKQRTNVYGGSIKSKYGHTLLGETRMVLYEGDQKIEATLIHSLRKTNTIIGSSQIFDIDNVEFTFKSPQTAKIYVVGIAGNTPPEMIYAFKIKDTSQKYVDLSVGRILNKHNLVMYVTNEWDIVARMENKGTVTKGDLVANVFGNNAKLDVLANITTLYNVSKPDLTRQHITNYTFTPQILTRSLLFDSQNSLVINGRSYAKVNITYLDDRDYEKKIVVRRFSMNTSDIIKSGVRDDLHLNFQSELRKSGSNKMEVDSADTRYYEEYNFVLLHLKMLINWTPYVLPRTITFDPHFENGGITLEYIREMSGEKTLFQIHAFNRREVFFVDVNHDRLGRINIVSQLRTNYVFDNLMAHAVLAQHSHRPNLKVDVTVRANTKDFEYRLNGQFNEIEKGGKILFTLTNDYSPPITVTAQYELKPKYFNINWDIRRDLFVLPIAFIDGKAPEAQGTDNGRLFAGSANITTSYFGLYYNLTSKFLLDDVEHTFDSSITRDRNKLGFYQKYCGERNKTCFEFNVVHAVKNSLLLDLRHFGFQKIYVEQASVSNNHTVEIVFDERAKYAVSILEVRNGIECSLITPRRHAVLDFHHSSLNSLVSASCDFYPNKLKSPHKTSLSLVCKSTSTESKCQLLMVDPNLPKSLMIKAMVRNDDYGNRLVTYIFDVFKRDEDKIVLEMEKTVNIGTYSESHKIMSKGLDFSCEYVAKVKIQEKLENGFEYVYGTNIQLGKKAYVNGLVARVFPNEMLFNMTAFNNQVIMLRARRFGSSLRTVAEGDLELLGAAPMYGRLTTRNFASLNFTTGFKNHLDKFELAAKLFGGDVIKAQATKNNTVLFATSLSMGDNCLDFDYRYNASNVDDLVLKPGKKVITQSQLVFENLLNQTSLTYEAHQVRQKIYGAIPDFANYLNFYLKNKKDFNDEMETEPALRYLNSFCANIFEIGYDNIVNGTYEDISTYISFYLFQDFEMMSTNMRLCRFMGDEIYEQLVRFNHFLGAHEKEMRQFGVDFFERVDEAFALLHVIKRSFLEAFNSFKDMEVWLKLSKQLGRGPPASPEQISKYKKVVADLRASTNSVEMIKLLNLLEAYTEKKLLKKYVNDEATLEEITDALEDVLLLIYDNDSSFWHILSLLIQALLLEFRVGFETRHLIDLKLDEARIAVAEEFDKLKFPQDFTGVFAKDYVFTFDNNHLTVNTNCELLLAQDTIDGNFSLRAFNTDRNEIFTFTDKKNTITFFKDGSSVSRNLGETNAFALDVSFNSNNILIKSKYGVQLDCDLSVVACVIKVSGYYHGRLEGLLGNANREAYDDFMLPNEKIESRPEKFVQSYATQQCSVIKTSTNAPSNPHCEDIFSEPTFKLCSKFVDPEPYKKACDESFDIGLSGSEEKISQVFGAICYERGVDINLYNETNFIL
ncbi:hypothetical protein FQR65_LT11964 [Abscondita terminalis]|nr:hypothetical protein FQR65_LT11964 [Abscondita terminalis]